MLAGEGHAPVRQASMGRPSSSWFGGSWRRHTQTPRFTSSNNPMAESESGIRCLGFRFPRLFLQHVRAADLLVVSQRQASLLVLIWLPFASAFAAPFAAPFTPCHSVLDCSNVVQIHFLYSNPAIVREFRRRRRGVLSQPTRRQVRMAADRAVLVPTVAVGGYHSTRWSGPS